MIARALRATFRRCQLLRNPSVTYHAPISQLLRTHQSTITHSSLLAEPSSSGPDAGPIFAAPVIAAPAALLVAPPPSGTSHPLVTTCASRTGACLAPGTGGAGCGTEAAAAADKPGSTPPPVVPAPSRGEDARGTVAAINSSPATATVFAVAAAVAAAVVVAVAADVGADDAIVAAAATRAAPAATAADLAAVLVASPAEPSADCDADETPIATAAVDDLGGASGPAGPGIAGVETICPAVPTVPPAGAAVATADVARGGAFSAAGVGGRGTFGRGAARLTEDPCGGPGAGRFSLSLDLETLPLPCLSGQRAWQQARTLLVGARGIKRETDGRGEGCVCCLGKRRRAGGGSTFCRRKTYPQQMGMLPKRGSRERRSGCESAGNISHSYRTAQKAH